MPVSVKMYNACSSLFVVELTAPGEELALSDILCLKHDSSILRQSSNPVFGFSMIEPVRLLDVWPMENWLGSSMNYMLGWKTVML